MHAAFICGPISLFFLGLYTYALFDSVERATGVDKCAWHVPLKTTTCNGVWQLTISIALSLPIIVLFSIHTVVDKPVYLEWIILCSSSLALLFKVSRSRLYPNSSADAVQLRLLWNLCHLHRAKLGASYHYYVVAIASVAAGLFTSGSIVYQLHFLSIGASLLASSQSFTSFSAIVLIPWFNPLTTWVPARVFQIARYTNVVAGLLSLLFSFFFGNRDFFLPVWILTPHALTLLTHAVYVCRRLGRQHGLHP